MGRQRDLELIIGSLRQDIAVRKTLWSGDKELPQVVVELEDLLERCKAYKENLCESENL